MNRMKYFLFLVVILSWALSSCVATPDRTTRLTDRLWLETDYDRRLASCPVDYRLERVLTRFGHTQVLIAGEKHEQTILLLHAMGLNLTSWFRNIEAFSHHFRILALDTIGDQGRSVVRRDYPRNAEEYSLWLHDIIEFYQLQSVTIIGCSMGGWIGHSYAISHPEYVSHLILISPAAGIPQKTTWLPLLMKMLFTNDEVILREVSQQILGFSQASQDWLDYMIKASKDPKSGKLGMPSTFTDAEIAQTGAKVLLLIGDAEMIYKNPDEVVARAKRLLPDVEYHQIPHAGHLGAWDNPEFVNAKILSFLGIHE